MHIDVTLYPSELKRIDQKGKTIVVIDVLRGSSTIIHALAHGCKEIHPVPDVKTASPKKKKKKKKRKKKIVLKIFVLPPKIIIFFFFFLGVIKIFNFFFFPHAVL